MKRCIDILPVIDIYLLVRIPTQPECLSFGFFTGLFIKDFHVVFVRRGFFLGISQYNLRNGFSVSLSKGTGLGGAGCWNFWLNDI